jgi:hypothetical protein
MEETSVQAKFTQCDLPCGGELVPACTHVSSQTLYSSTSTYTQTQPETTRQEGSPNEKSSACEAQESSCQTEVSSADNTTDVSIQVNTTMKHTESQTEDAFCQDSDNTATTPEGYIHMLVRAPHMPLGFNFHKKQLIVNEVLCFIQNKLDNEPRENIVNLAQHFYKHDEVLHAKKILYDAVPVEGRRFKTHRGETKMLMDLNDIFYHLHSAPLIDTPIFVAMDTSRLPPMSGKASDMTVILQNIEILRTQVEMLAEAQTVSTDFMAKCSRELNSSDHYKVLQKAARTPEHCAPKSSPQLQTPAPTTPTEARATTSTQHHPLRAQPPQKSPIQSEISETESDLDSNLESDMDSTTDEPKQEIATRIHSEPAAENLRVLLPPPSEDIFTENRDNHDNQEMRTSRTRPDVCVSHPSKNEKWSVVKTRYFTSNKQDRPNVSKPQTNQQKSLNNLNNNVQTNENSVTNKNTRVTLGTGSAPGLRVVSNPKSVKGTDNKSCTGVFITKFIPSTTSNQLESYVKSEMGVHVRAEKLQTKYDSYSSFYIRCSGQLRTSLLDGRNWPTGSLVKPYMS